MLLAETNEGFHNLIKLVSAGYTEGFYYKPRIDKDLLARHAKGLIGLSSCLKGEVATRNSDRAASGKRSKRRRSSATSWGTATSSSRCSTRASRSSWSSTRDWLPIARELNMPLVATNDVHYLTHGDHHPHDILLCIGTGKTVNDRDRLALSRRSVLPEDRGGDGARCSARCPTRWRTRCALPSAATSTSRADKNYLPNFAVPAPYTLNDYFEHVVREGFVQRLVSLEGAARVRARCVIRSRTTRTACRTRSR